MPPTLLYYTSNAISSKYINFIAKYTIIPLLSNVKSKMTLV